MVDKWAAVKAVWHVAWPFSLFCVDSSFSVTDTMTFQTRTNFVHVVRLFVFSWQIDWWWCFLHFQQPVDHHIGRRDVLVSSRGYNDVLASKYPSFTNITDNVGRGRRMRLRTQGAQDRKGRLSEIVKKAPVVAAEHVWNKGAGTKPPLKWAWPKTLLGQVVAEIFCFPQIVLKFWSSKMAFPVF